MASKQAFADCQITSTPTQSQHPRQFAVCISISVLHPTPPAFAESCGVLDHHGIARARAQGTRPALRQPAQCALSCGRCVPCYRCHEGPTRGLSPRMGPSSRLMHPGRPWPLLRFARSWVPRETPASDLSSRYLRGRPVRVQSHLRPRVTVPVPSCALGRWLRSSAYASNKITEAEHGHHWMATTVCCTFCSGSYATQQGGVAHSGRVWPPEGGFFQSRFEVRWGIRTML